MTVSDVQQSAHPGSHHRAACLRARAPHECAAHSAEQSAALRATLAAFRRTWGPAASVARSLRAPAVFRHAVQAAAVVCHGAPAATSLRSLACPTHTTLQEAYYIQSSLDT